MPTYTAEDLSKHAANDDLWLLIGGKVYDVTEYLDEHPGGSEILLDCANIDSTSAFEDVGHSQDAKDVLEDLYIGDYEGAAPDEDAAAASKPAGAYKGQEPVNMAILMPGAVLLVAVLYYFFG